MRKMCVVNYKGGTGKTTTVVNLAHGLALQNKKVLIIEADPQGAIAHILGFKNINSLYDLLLSDIYHQNCIHNVRPNLDVIFGNARLFAAEIELVKHQARETTLANKLKNLNGYDYVIVDCAPTFNLLNQNVLYFVDEILIPVSMEYLSLIGVKQLLQNIKLLNKTFNKAIKITKVIPTFYDKRNKKSRDVMESLAKVFPNLVAPPIRTNIALAEAAGYKQTIFEYNPKSIGAADYQNLINEVFQ